MEQLEQRVGCSNCTSTSPGSMSDLLGEMKTRLVEFLDSTKRNLDGKNSLIMLFILKDNEVKVIKQEGCTSSGQEKLR
ncbi:hypothetical protein B9Z55_028833 [Caenorhabditis nigoni]|uniref:Uncharacterized protein n=1 Tax=Caenorhabditis nigoni TaxID=1611254 RepID=A0A2G5S9R8_9PELO|nr:hypothetical protein B9Z55_028833 [Caenorhabditis nigoni]